MAIGRPPWASERQEVLGLSEFLDVRVKRIIEEAEDIRSYEFADPRKGALPAFTAGSHLDVHLPNGLVRQYSLCNDPRESHRYVVAVLREPGGRGGSACMHDAVREGDDVTITVPRNHFPLHENAERHLLIAGGIGITPILAMARRLAALGADYTVHYCTRSPEKTAFRAALTEEPFAGHVRFHHDGGDPTKGLDVRALLADVEAGTHVYCCGPIGLMHAVTEASAHWPLGTVHFEFFATDPSVAEEPKAGFEVEIASTGAVYQVPPDKTILEVLRDRGHDIDSSCEEGLCGTCIVDVLDGEPDHRDLVLDDEEKQSNKLITVCCSRAKSARLKLDL
jgi:vanillate monooxygenase ferredoxin subunit